MTNREREILEIIKKQPDIEQSEIASRLNIARASVAVHISNLQKKGYISGRIYLVNDFDYAVGIGAANVDICGRSKNPIIMADSNPGAMSISLGGVTRNICENLARLGGSSVTVEEVLGAAEPLHYRNKSQYPVSADGKVGFYRARTHQVTDLSACLIQKPQADAAAGALRRYMAAQHVPGYDEKTGQGLVRHLYVRTNAKGQSLICVVVNGERLPGEEALVEAMRQAVRSAVGVVLNVNTRRSNVILGDRYRTLWGEDTLTDTLCGHSFRLSIPAFYQVNRDQAEVLYCKAVEYAGLTGTELVLDLYCGAGTITLTMADRAKKVIGAEIVAPAVENARENAAANGIENVEFFCGDAGDIAARLAEERLRPEVICVDPPRKGLAPEVIDAMVQMGPERIVYVSCDPATLGRDVKLLAQRGYAARRAAAVDLFPGTAHVETVVLMSRVEGK